MVRMFIVALLLLAGCTQTPAASPTGVPPSSAAATPTYTCSPAGGTPAPCSKDEYDKVQSENALIAEAEAVYRKFWDENVRINQMGGVKAATPTLRETTTGMFLEATLATYQEILDEGLTGVGDVKLVTLTPRSDLIHEGSLISLEACTDASNLEFRRGKRRVDNGPIYVEEVYLKRFDGALKLFYVQSKLVKSCS